METLFKRAVGTAAVCCLALVAPLSVAAQPTMGGGAMHGASGHPHLQPGAGHDAMHPPHLRHPGHHGMGWRGDRETAGMLRGLNLTEEQRDKVFAVLHAQAPQLRTQAKEVRNARRELRTLTLSEAYDEARAHSLSATIAGATARIALIRSRSANEIYRVLGPEQRRLLQERAASREDARRGGARFNRG